MRDAESDLIKFHTLFHRPIRTTPGLIDPKLSDMRVELLLEEVSEYLEAVRNKDLVSIFDALLDIIYIAVGTGVTYGLPMAKGWEEVHASNMAKLGIDGAPIYREDGKVMKPAGWVPPDLAGIVERSQRHDSSRTVMPMSEPIKLDTAHITLDGAINPDDPMDNNHKDGLAGEFVTFEQDFSRNKLRVRYGYVTPARFAELRKQIPGLRTYFNGEDITDRCTWANDGTGEAEVYVLRNGKPYCSDESPYDPVKEILSGGPDSVEFKIRTL